MNEVHLSKILENVATPSERIKALRKKVLRLSRGDFVNISGSTTTLAMVRHWENGQTAVNTDAASRLVNLFKLHGMKVSVEWLLDGAGEMPVIESNTFLMQPATHDTGTLEYEVAFSRQLLDFKDSAKNTIVHQVEGEWTMPFEQGDFVGGYLGPQSNYEAILNTDCIAVTTGNEILIGRFVKNLENEYHLLSQNRVGELLITKVKSIAKAARIVFILRKENPDFVEIE